MKPSDYVVLNINFTFDDKALLSLKSPKKAKRQIEFYALDGDRQILFHSESKPITINPMQVFGAESIMEEKGRINSWYSVWVTPMADSITAMIDEIAAKLLYKDEVENGNFKSGESEIVDIEKARESGILPNDVQ